MMGLFDDNFYSTKVTRRARKEKMREMPFRFGRTGNWSSLRIAAVSSLASAIVAVLLFTLVTGAGFGSNRSNGNHAMPVAATSGLSNDPLERTIQASAKVRPAVVSIINEQSVSGQLGLDDETDNPDDNPLEEAGVGSGVIYAKAKGKALVITNYHVVANADKVKAVLLSGETREAKVVGKDQISDLAVLEIDGKGIDTVAEIGDSSKLRQAEWVIAIGNPLGLGDSISMGIVSKTRRTIPVSLNQDGVYDWEMEVIQIDASINQGNSGGPLIDLNGRVVGINSMKIADFGVEGVGFAIPINDVMPIVEKLREQGKIARPYLGIYSIDLEQHRKQQKWLIEGEEETDEEAEVEGSDDLDEETIRVPDDVSEGIIVLEAVGPAKKAGLKFSDLIVKLDKQDVGSTLELRKYLYSEKKIGDSVEVTFYRNGEKMTTKLKLEERTDEEE